MWTPQFVCPECRVDIGRTHADTTVCGRCGRRYQQRDGIWRFLTPARSEALAAFTRQYRLVRLRDGRGRSSPERCRHLPVVEPDDPHAAEWRIRSESYRHLLRSVAPRRGRLHVLDLGAGNGWLSHRLAALGHSTVAVDIVDDDADGLGACRCYQTPFAAVQADFDALPFAAGQFDLVVFNGSLHYAPDARATLARTRALLAPDGILVVMDSPMFRMDDDGRAMVADETRRFQCEYGLPSVTRIGAGYLTFPSLADVASALRLSARFVPSKGSLGWRARRLVARAKLGRAPAAFGLWVAR